jgi:hypothetical protein
MAPDANTANGKASRSVADSAPGPTTVADASSQDASWRRVRILGGLGLIALVTVCWAAILYVWLRTHGVKVEQFLSHEGGFMEALAEFGFLGLSDSNPQPSILSLCYEISVWSFFGVTIRTIFRASTALRSNRFDFLKYIAQWAGDMMMGAGMAEAAILFLRISNFSLGSATLTLAESSYETIAALAFILGFYHEDARRLLGKIRGKVVNAVPTAGESSEAEERP